jgi:hypothetical protein
VVAEVAGSVPGVAKIINFSENPEFTIPVLVGLDIVGYGIATVAYFLAALD